jgi:hypothetical protein
MCVGFFYVVRIFIPIFCLNVQGLRCIVGYNI